MRRTVIELERLFAASCHEAYPYEWDENHISFLLMRGLREMFSNRIVRFTNFSKIVDWQSFKNRGKQETNYGDIALLVNIQFTTGETLRGVACLEAKKHCISGSFDALELSQVQHIHNMAPYAHLLLYLYWYLDLPIKFPDERDYRSHIWVSPLNTVRQLLPQIRPRDHEKLFRIAFPFAMFLASRVFWGHDLDYRTDIYDDLLVGNSKLFDPAYLAVVNIHYENQRPVEVILGEQWEQI